MKTNDAIVSQLLEMNGGVGFDTEDLFAAMNDARADERAKIIDMLNSVCYDTHNNETRRIEHRVKAEIIELITRKHK